MMKIFEFHSEIFVENNLIEKNAIHKYFTFLTPCAVPIDARLFPNYLSKSNMFEGFEYTVPIFSIYCK